MGILDTVSLQEQTTTLRNFNPFSFVSEYLDKLKPREKQILVLRYGLETGQPETLENIGKVMNLTRERVRQIEKETTARLFKGPVPANLTRADDLIFKFIEDHGNLLRQDRLLELVLPHDRSAVSRQRVLFFLHLSSRFSSFAEDSDFHQGWQISGFDRQLLESVVKKIREIFSAYARPAALADILAAFRSSPGISPEEAQLPDEAVESYMSMSKSLGRNPWEEWGLQAWPAIRPRDVGDKAVLVLQHHGKPEHYAVITEMINKHEFDDRTAHNETVHNELIKDPRFVLVGRGIYALADWGYKQGVVGDIIEQVLRQAQTPLTREQIIEQVLKQRLVKKNTVIVGLANRGRFAKTADNKYTNAK